MTRSRWTWAAIAIGLLSLATSAGAQTLSEEFPLAPPVRIPGGFAMSPSVACNSTTCLVAWGQWGAAVAVRTDLTGRVLDDPVLVLGDAAESVAVAARGDEDFLVAWAAEATPGNPPLASATRVRASDGAILDSPALTLKKGIIESIAADSKTYAVLQTAASNYFLTRVGAGAVLDAGGIALGSGSAGAFSEASVVAGVDQFGVAWDNKFARVSAAGKLLDSTPVAISKHLAVQVSLAFDGTNYVAVWSPDTVLHASRIRGSDGVLLDVDDDFNDKAGGVSACEAWAGFSVAHLIGGKLSIAYSTTSGSTYKLYGIGFPLSPWPTAELFCPNQSELGTSDRTRFSMSLRNGHGVLAYIDPSRSNITVRQVTSDSNGKLSVGPERTVGYTAPDRFLRVASNGLDFLVASYDADRKGLYVTRIDGLDGSLVPNSEQAVPGASQAAIASNGRDYFLAWSDKNGTHGNLVSCDGTVGPRVDLSSLSLGNRDLRMAFDGFNYLVMGDAFGAVRVRASDLTVLDAAPLRVNNDSSLARNFDVAGDRQDDPTRGTFMVLWNTPAGGTVTQRIRSFTGALLAPVQIAAPDGQERVVKVASGAPAFLAVWPQDIAQQRHALWSAPIDAVTGDVTGAGRKATVAAAGFARTTWLTHDGVGHVLTWLDEVASGTRITRIGSSGDALDLANGGLMTGTGTADVASNRYGRTLIARMASSSADLGMVPRGVLLKNGGSTVAEPDSGVLCALAFPQHDAGADASADAAPSGLDGGAFDANVPMEGSVVSGSGGTATGGASSAGGASSSAGGTIATGAGGSGAMTTVADASAGSDAAVAEETTRSGSQDGGCGCRTSASRPGSRALLGIALLTLGCFRRRKHRRHVPHVA